MCSARSFSSARSSASSAASSAASRPRGRVPAMGCVVTDAVLHAHQHLRRRADDVGVAEAQVVHVRRWVDGPQRAVDLERAGAAVGARQPLREDDLDGVAGDDVLARPLDRPHELARGSRSTTPRGAVSTHLGAASRRRLGSGCVRRSTSSSMRQRRLPVGGVDVAVEAGVADHLDLVLEVVEDEERVGEHEDGFGQRQRVVGRRGQPLEVARRLVRQVADGAAVEARQAGHRDDVEAPQLVFDLAAAGRRRCPRAGQDAIRLRADEAVASQALAALDALQQERVLVRARPSGRRRRASPGRPSPLGRRAAGCPVRPVRAPPPGLGWYSAFSISSPSQQTKNPSS